MTPFFIREIVQFQRRAVKQLCFSVIKASYTQLCFGWFGKHVPNEIQHMNCFIRAVKWKILIHISAEKYFVWVGGKWPLCSTCTSISGSQLFGHLTISLVICRRSTTSTPIAPSGITLRGAWWATGPPKAANSWTPTKHTPPAPAAISPTLPSSWRTEKFQYVHFLYPPLTLPVVFQTFKIAIFQDYSNHSKVQREDLCTLLLSSSAV